MINNSAVDCSVSVKFGMTSDELQMLKVKGSKVKVITWYNMGKNVLNRQ